MQFADALAQPTVTVTPDLITEGTDVTLTCASTTSGTLTYAWFKDNVATGDTTTTLTLTSFSTASHAGAYACQVTAGGVASVKSTAVSVTAASKFVCPMYANLSLPSIVQYSCFVLSLFDLCYIEPGDMVGNVTETRNTVCFIGSLIMD